MDQSVRWHRIMQRRLSRRRVLQGGSLAALGVGVFSVVGCDLTPNAPREATPTPRPRRVAMLEPLDPPTARYAMSEWSQHARIANATGLGDDPTEEEMRQIIDNLIAQNVNVIEADTVLSDWLTDEQFDAMMAAATHFNRMVHASGLRVVWYYPSLEILSPEAEDGPSFYKQHPDWVQVSMAGQPNVFIGGGEDVKVVFWVERGVESMWLSPNSPWRDYYLERVKRIAQTGSDAIWPDVPLYFDVVHLWCDTSPWARAAFRADTGLEVPPQIDWSNPTWRRWVEWRHRNLNRWCLDIAAAGRSVNPEFETFIETVPCDHMDATTMGLDGGYLRLAEGITQAWEVDTVSDDWSMYYASDDDWICMISIYKYCRAASGRKPAWTFTKGWRAEDAAQVMAEGLAAGCNPYEVQVPGKTVGSDAAMRTRWYAFVKANTERLFDAMPLARVALYHSSSSRDYVAPLAEGGTPSSGVYTSTVNPVPQKHWWSDRPADSRYELQWLGEYTGALKALVHSHIPFTVLTSPTFRAEDLEGHEVLLLADIEAMSDHEAEIFRQFVHAGGTIVATGPNPGGLNEYGDPRSEFALADVLGISRRTPLPATQHHRFGDGQAFWFADFPGRQYLNQTEPTARDRLVGAVLQGLTPFITTDADPRVHLEATTFLGDTILHFTNLTGVRGLRGFTVAPTRFTVWVQVPDGKEVQAVETSSPDVASPALAPLDFSASFGQVRFALDLVQYALVVIRWA